MGNAGKIFRTYRILPPNLEIEYQPIGFQSIHRFASLLPRYLERSYSVANQEGEFDVRSRIRGGRNCSANIFSCLACRYTPRVPNVASFLSVLPPPRSIILCLFLDPCANVSRLEFEQANREYSRLVELFTSKRNSLSLVRSFWPNDRTRIRQKQRDFGFSFKMADR